VVPAPPAVEPAVSPSAYARETAETLTASLATALEQTIAAAEQSADELRRDAVAQSERVVAEAAERAREEAARIRREAREEATEYLRHAREEVDQHAQARIARIATIADRLSNDSEVVLAQLTEAAALRQALDGLLTGLTEASQAALREARSGALALGPDEPAGD